MGLCIYCNLKVTGTTTTCPKCYRTIALTKDRTTETKSTSPVFTIPKKPNQSNIDKWQDTYSKKAIFNSGISTSTSTPLKSRQQRPMPTFSKRESTASRLTKICTHCQKPQTSWKDLSIYNSAYYCKPCLSEVLACPGCKKPVEQGEGQTFFNKKTWHAACLKCATCDSPLKAMLAIIDADGKPSCRNCRTKVGVPSRQLESPSPSPQSSSASTPLLNSSAVPSMATQTPASKVPPAKPRRASAAPLPLNDLKTASSPSEVSDSKANPVLSTTDNGKTPGEPLSPKIGTTKEEVPAAEPALTTSTAHRRKKVAKKPCKECGLHVSKRDYRGLKIHTGETLIFHSYCLFCAKCQQPFNTLEFCTDGFKFYHTQCPPTISIPPRNSTPVSEEDEAYPRTPPSGQAYFNIAAPSPTDSTMSSPIQPGLSSDGPEDKKDSVSPPEEEALQPTTQITCNACSKPVTDTCLELADQFYHKECLLCAGCNKTVPTDRKLIKYQKKLYCDVCSVGLINKQRPSRVGNTLQINTQSAEHQAVGGEEEKQEHIEVPKRNTSVTSPSDIFKTRKKVLPRLGGVRTCARCNQSMPFSDTQPGPNASRWHKKCLRCAGCNKQMDSDAHMTVNDKTGLCLVHCRDCLDDTPRPRFVRR